MNERWKRGLSPFDGDCLVTDDLLSVEDLRSLFTTVVSRLEQLYGAQRLYTFDDWHQHDGYITERRLTDWNAMKAVSKTAEALIESRQGDTYVHRSFYPADCTFLLRYDIPDDDIGEETGFTGAFDLSAQPAVVANLMELLPPGFRPLVRIEPSKEYFDRTYVG